MMVAELEVGNEIHLVKAVATEEMNATEALM